MDLTEHEKKQKSQSLKKLNNNIMKKIVFLLLSFFFFNGFFVFAQIDTVSLKSFRLKGKIASVTDYSYLLKEDDKAKDFSLDGKNYMTIPLNEEWKLSEKEDTNQETNVTFDFDREGKNVKITYYFTPGKPNDVTVFKYDKKGKIIESENSLFYSDGKYNIESIYTYDAKGTLIKSKKQEGGRIIQEATFKYNDDGHLIEKVVTSDGSVAERNIRDFERDNMILENLIIPNKERKSVFRYNENNQLIYSKISYPEHGVFHEATYEYSDGLLKKVSHLNDLDQATICLYEYNNGKLAKERCFDAKDADKFSFEKENKYKGQSKAILMKKNDVLLEEKEYDISGYINNYKTETFTYSYQYKRDAKGNWIQVIQYENGKPIKLRTREIKYY